MKAIKSISKSACVDIISGWMTASNAFKKPIDVPSPIAFIINLKTTTISKFNLFKTVFETPLPNMNFETNFV